MSSDIGKRTLSVQTDVPTAEIFALDHNDDIVARGVGSLAAELAPGIYQLRYRLGAKVVDQIVRVPTGDGTISVNPPELPIDTPAPLPSDPNGADWARQVDEWTATVDVAKGRESQVFLVVNQAGLAEPDRLPDETRAAVTVRTFAGQKIADLAEGRVCDGSLCLGVELDPGSYLVRIEDGSAPCEQTVVACAGWQTQLFFRPVAGRQNPTLDLSQSALRMSSIANGLRSDDRMFRWTEAARQSLANWRYTAVPNEKLEVRNRALSQIRNAGPDDAQVRQMLHEKFGNPMLGIYGAHLSICNPQPDRALLCEVVDNLRYLIGDHPDVMAVALFLDHPAAQDLSFPTPPMLRSSWDFIVQRQDSGRRIPAGSYAFSIGGAVCGAGAGLAWRVPPAPSSMPVADQPVDWQKLIDAVSTAADVPGRAKELMQGGGLTPAERVLLGSLIMSALRVTTAKEFVSEEDQDRALTYYPVKMWRQVRSHPLVRDTRNAVRGLSATDLSKATGIPLSTLESAAAALSQKLGVEPSSSSIANVIRAGVGTSSAVISSVAKRLGLD